MELIFKQILIGFIVFFVIFTLLEKLTPSIKDKKILRDGYRLDLMYWVLAPTLNALVKKVFVLLSLFIVALILNLELNQNLLNGFGPVSKQPIGLIVFEVIVLGDFIGYWTHRLFHHSQRLWQVHAVHHSSTQLDWLSSVRVHPLNQAINSSISVVIFLLLGFPLNVVAGYLPFIIFYAVLLHANVSWDFGFLRSVLASPRFHRWHHTKETEALDKNFAGLFPIFDIVFGTYYMPKDKTPTIFGVKDPIPMTLWGQLIYPFKKLK